MRERPLENKRWIAHVDMDSFYVSVERLKNPSLLNKPVAVGGSGRRGVISSASYEARKFGVRSAMPTGQALRLCPQLIVVDHSFSEYSRISHLIFAELEKLAPVVEQVSVDEAYLDFTGCERLFSSREESGRAVKEAVKRVSGLNSTVGLSTNKLISKIASDLAKPDGLLVVEAGKEQEFLAPLSIRKIPGVGTKTAPLFEAYGIRTCDDLVKQDPRRLKSQFGDYALDHQRAARGESTSEVGDSGPRKSLGSEETFEYDVGDENILCQELKRMAEEIASGLRDEKIKARTIQIKMRFSDFRTIVRASTLEQSSFIAGELAAVAIALLKEHRPPQEKLRLIGMSARNFVDSDGEDLEQFNFFEKPESRIKKEKIEFLKDDLKKRFGKKVLKLPE